jgi:hypothetical protein
LNPEDELFGAVNDSSDDGSHINFVELEYHYQEEI